MITLADGFWNVNPKYQYMDIFNGFNKGTILHLWFLLIMYDFWLFLLLYKLYFHNDIFNYYKS